MNAPPTKPSGKTNPVPRSKRLTRVMRKHGTQRLEKLRQEIYDSLSDTAPSRALPPTVYLPQPVIISLLDNYALLTSANDLRSLLSGRTYVLPHVDRLWLTLEALRPEFEAIRAKAAEERKWRAAEKAAAARAATAASSSATMSSEELEAAMQAVLDEESEESEDELECFRRRHDTGMGEGNATAGECAPAQQGTTDSSTFGPPPSQSLSMPSTASSLFSPPGSLLAVLGPAPLPLACTTMENMPGSGVALIQSHVAVQAIEEGPGYAMHVLSFGTDADTSSSRARRKRTAPQEPSTPAGSKPPRKRRRISDKENCVGA